MRVAFPAGDAPSAGGRDSLIGSVLRQTNQSADNYLTDSGKRGDETETHQNENRGDRSAFKGQELRSPVRQNSTPDIGHGSGTMAPRLLKNHSGVIVIAFNEEMTVNDQGAF